MKPEKVPNNWLESATGKMYADIEAHRARNEKAGLKLAIIFPGKILVGNSASETIHWFLHGKRYF